MQRIASVAFALFAAQAACAQNVQLQGMLGRKALLVIDGGAPRIVAPGESIGPVKVLSTSGDTAVIEVDGRHETLRVGESPASVGGAAAPPQGTRIVLNASQGGHFVTEGRINGQQVKFMVDTGATTIAMSEADAKRLNVAYKGGRMTTVSTANGPVNTWLTQLTSVRIGDVEVRDVEAAVLPSFMPYVLLGNSFLNRFQMTRQNDLMVLERRY